MEQPSQSNVSERIGVIREQVRKLEKLDGWMGLSDRQRKTIEQSLYIQDRALRTPDNWSREAVVSPHTHATSETRVLPGSYLENLHQRMQEGDDEQEPMTEDEVAEMGHPNQRVNRASQEHVSNWYCHAAVLALEKELPLAEATPELPADFFIGEYISPKTEQDITDLITKQGFPCIVHIKDVEDSIAPGFDKKHSFVALGVDGGNIVIWDKEGDQLPYAIRTLAQVVQTYGLFHYWGVRNFKQVVL